MISVTLISLALGAALALLFPSKHTRYAPPTEADFEALMKRHGL